MLAASYFVANVSGKNVTVVPDVAGSCATCKKECAKRNPGFIVYNSQGFEVMPGDKVKIGTFSGAETLRNIMSICFPVLCAVIGYCWQSFFSSTPIPITDAKRAGTALIFLIAGALAIFIFSLIRPASQKLEIIKKI